MYLKILLVIIMCVIVYNRSYKDEIVNKLRLRRAKRVASLYGYDEESMEFIISIKSDLASCEHFFKTVPAEEIKKTLSELNYKKLVLLKNDFTK